MSQHSRRSSVSSQGRTRRDSAAGLSRLTSMTRRDSSTSVGTGRLGMLASALALRRKVSSVLAVKESKAKVNSFFRGLADGPAISHEQTGLLEETTLLDAHYLRLSEDSENTDPHRHVSDVLATSGVGDVHDVGVLNGVHPKDPASPFYSPEDDLHDLTPSSVDKDHYMFFDPSFFKANRQIITSFRGISTIAELPVRMQKNLARFVVEAVKDDETGLAKIVCHMQRGESFGELAIINHSVRCSSVLTQSYTELLAIPDSVSGKKVKVRNDSLKKKL
ncbi:hypothetical protein C0Q70_15689 [Pomacea canaliculata]|uniref:Cyclic nucleotide-binding domain-containing protein n=1 Tax=Pomacea canaliculata TaxID=400727 RepID=A0A2T7NVJ4_POMCA|nr:hypothetical protein C0Q70_15689 [Pomacea canaliculata]